MTLQEALDLAVAEERYEDAAWLRDRIIANSAVTDTEVWKLGHTVTRPSSSESFRELIDMWRPERDRILAEVIRKNFGKKRAGALLQSCVQVLDHRDCTTTHYCMGVHIAKFLYTKEKLIQL